MPYILTSTANPSSPQSWVKMETESILSGHSEYNQRLVNGHRTTPRPLPPLKGEIFFWGLAWSDASSVGRIKRDTHLKPKISSFCLCMAKTRK